MPYIGKSIESGTFSDLGFTGTFNSSTTDFNLGTQVGSPAQLIVSKNGVIQRPGTDFTLASGGSQISFTTAPASGDSIFIVEISGAVGGPLDSDLNGNELILDTDGDTSITADTDDQIDIKIGGADDFAFKANKFEVQTGSNVDMNGTELILDADGDTSITADTDDQIDFKTGGTDRALINSSGRVIIGHSSQLNTGNTIAGVQVHGTDNDSASLSIMRFNSGGGSADLILGQSRNSSIGGNTIVNDADNVGMIKFVADDGTDYISSVAEIRCDIDAAPGANDTPGRLRFSTTADGSNSVTERMRIGSTGHVFVGKTTTAIGTAGTTVFNYGEIYVTRSGQNVGLFNRLSNDGQIFGFLQASNTEGTINVSGSTVSYNGFTGTHWSRLADNSKPTILRGTIMESLDEMCDWYQAVADVAEVKDSEGNVTTAAHQVKEYINLGSKSVGDSITFTSKGVEYTGKIEKEGDVKHSKAKVSDTSESKAVYGLFVTWDEDDTNYNDMLVAQTGTFVIRIHKDETVSKGDLIQSKGDGTGKVQADDIMRASTVAKVLSTTKIETYSDGSYIVPCSLHC